VALVACPECGWNVSSKATACPQCGSPLGAGRKVDVLHRGLDLLSEVMSGSALTAEPKIQADPDPGDLRKWEGAVGQSLLFQVTGQTSGPVYGTDIYTSDSRLAAAAVHAGVLQTGETRIVRVWIVPVLPNYRGTSRNGVVSRDWDASWTGAYRIERSSGA
jgi:hypothetical protein